MSGLFQFLTWVEVVGARNDMESNARESQLRAQAQERQRFEEKVKEQFRKLYETQSIYSIDPEVFEKIAADANSTYQMSKRRTPPEYAIFKPMMGLGVFWVLGYNIDAFKELLERPSFALKIFSLGGFVFLMFIGIGLVLGFFDSKEARKRFFANKEELVFSLKALHKEYGMLSLYGMRLKGEIDRHVKSLYLLLSQEDPVRAQNALKLIYEYCKMPKDTPVRMDYNFSLLGWVDEKIEQKYRELGPYINDNK